MKHSLRMINQPELNLCLLPVFTLSNLKKNARLKISGGIVIPGYCLTLSDSLDNVYFTHTDTGLVLIII